MAGIRGSFSRGEGAEDASGPSVKNLLLIITAGLLGAGCDAPVSPRAIAQKGPIKELHVKIAQRMSDQMARGIENDLGPMIIIGDPGWLAGIYDGDQIVFDGYFTREISYETVGAGQKITPVYKNDPEATKTHEREQAEFKAQLAAEADARRKVALSASLKEEEQVQIQIKAAAEAARFKAAKAAELAAKASAELRERSARELAELETKAGAK